MSQSDSPGVDWGGAVQIPDEVLAEIYGDGAVVLNVVTGDYVGLDRVGSIFWQALDAGSLDSAHAWLIGQFDVDARTL